MGSQGNIGQRNSFNNPMPNWRSPYGSINANQSSWNMPDFTQSANSGVKRQIIEYHPPTEQGGGNAAFPQTPPPTIAPTAQIQTPEQQYQNNRLTTALPAFGGNTQPQPTDTGGGNAAFPQTLPLTIAPTAQTQQMPKTIAPPAFNYNTQPNNFGFLNNYRGGK